MTMKKKPEISDNHFFQQLEWVSIEKVNWLSQDDKAEQGIRLYCTSANKSWNLQIRGQIKLGTGRLGKDYIVASTSVPKAMLVALRDAIDRQLKAEAPRGRSPRNRARDDHR